jgi:hypothetical protein
MGDVLPIEREALVATAEILELESWLEDDIKCQSGHRDARNARCTRDVTHLAYTCIVERVPICRACAEYIQLAVDGTWGDRCGGCFESISGHWKTEPV